MYIFFFVGEECSKLNAIRSFFSLSLRSHPVCNHFFLLLFCLLVHAAVNPNTEFRSAQSNQHSFHITYIPKQQKPFHASSHACFIRFIIRLKEREKESDRERERGLGRDFRCYCVIVINLKATNQNIRHPLHYWKISFRIANNYKVAWIYFSLEFAKLKWMQEIFFEDKFIEVKYTPAVVENKQRNTISVLKFQMENAFTQPNHVYVLYCDINNLWNWI